MATYKVIQDIEAEDKLVGPLTLKQFIFAGIAALIGFLGFTIAKATSPYVFVAFLPLIAPPLILALPLGRDQPTDVWLAAQIRFFLKPRKRIWDQSGLKELVTITAPKKIEHAYTDGLSQQEVRSRLKALADTIDSRGWAVKNVNLNLYSNPTYTAQSSDRLVDAASLPQNVTDAGIRASDDMLDASSNPTAQHFDELVRHSAQQHRAEALATVEQARQQAATPTTQKAATPPDDFYFMHQPEPAQVPADNAMFGAQVVAPGQPTNDNTFLHTSEPTVDENKALEEIKAHHVDPYINPHHKSIKTPAQLRAEAARAATSKPAQPSAQPATKPPVSRATIELSQTNDVSVASIAQIAKHQEQQQAALNNGDEVIVSLR